MSIDSISSFEEATVEMQEIALGEGVSSCNQNLSERKLRRKLDLRVALPSFLLCTIAYIDRSNISNARILNQSTNDSLSQAVNLSDIRYGIISMAFLIGYMLFEAPSNLLLKKLRPSRWIAFLIFSCGAVNLGLSAIRTYPALAGLRFLLGVFEAGLLPGLMYLITFWYRPSERAVRVAAITSATKLSGAVGGLTAYAIGNLNGSLGLQGWRWLFLLEGIPACIAGVLTYFFFPNFPETASWLSHSERELAVSRLHGVGSQGHAKVSKNEILSTLTDWRLYGHYIIDLCVSIPISSLFLFSPSIINGLGFKDLQAQLLTIPPYALGFVASILVSMSADHFNSKPLHIFLAMLVASISYLIQAFIPDYALIPRYVSLCISAGATFSVSPVAIAWLSNNIRSTGASGFAIALNISFGAVGQMIGAWIYKDSEAPGYKTGHLTNFAVLLLGSILSLGMRQLYSRRNSRLPAGGIPWDI